jgi:hypothetical protein
MLLLSSAVIYLSTALGKPMVAGFTRIGIEFCLAWALIPVKPMALGFTLPKKKIV